MTCSGQANYIEISGRVFSHPAPFYEETDTIYINNVVVVLAIEDSVEMRAVTDINGNYNFKIAKTNKQGKLSTRTDKSSGNTIKYMDGFLATAERKSVDLNDANQRANFYVGNIFACGWNQPIFLFEKNKSSPNDAFMCVKLSVDSAVTKIYNYLNKYFYLTIQLDGNCDLIEKYPRVLSVERARIVKGLIVAKGISEARVSIVGYGATRPIEKTYECNGFKQLIYPKGVLHSRVGLKIVSMDYGIKRKSNEKEEE